MERRELLKLIALATGSAVIGGEFLLSGCSNPAAKENFGVFKAEDVKFLDEVAETILPRTKTPGAKDAETGKFMTVMVNDCYDAKDQAIFLEGINKLDEACRKMHGHSFMKASADHRKELLTALDKEAKVYSDAKKKEDPNHYFTMMKQLTLLGYFTSKPALTQAFDYHETPGKYNGEYSYKKGDKLFA